MEVIRGENLQGGERQKVGEENGGGGDGPEKSH